MGFPRSKIDTDYLLSPDGVFKILALVLTMIATIVILVGTFATFGTAGNSFKYKGLNTGDTHLYIRFACIFSLVVGAIIFFLVLFHLAKKIKPFAIIDAVFCFLFAVLLFAAGIVAAILSWTGTAVFCFLATVAWVFSGIMAAMLAAEGGKVGP